MHSSIIPYNREVATSYAHQWAFQRNPAYYNYDEIGGDCTNFASQCLYSAIKVMNFTPIFGWYYVNSNQKAPAWSGVEYFFNFMTRKQKTSGPFGEERGISEVEPGDFVQLSFDGFHYIHNPIVVSVGNKKDLDQILIAAHSYDSDWRPLSSYQFHRIRFIHIIGGYS